MGRSTTPPYRVVLSWSFEGQQQEVRMAWPTKDAGRPTADNLEKYVMVYAKSLEKGGVNFHVSTGLGYVPYPQAAMIVRQRDNELVAEWKAGMFQVYE